MRALRLAIALAERGASACIVLLLAGMVLVVLSQFVDRYFTPIWGGVPGDEYVKVGLVWLTFLGFGLAMRAGAEIRVDFLDQHMPAGVVRVLYALFDLAMLAVLGVILWKSVRLYEVGKLQTILGTDMTVALPVLGMMLGCGLMAIALLSRFLRRMFKIEL